MARRNAGFNRWCVHEISSMNKNVRRVVELGPGPGIGLQETLRAFPVASVWGVDLSPEMLAQSRKRNLEQIQSGRLTLLEGDVASLEKLAPADIILAVQVLYYLHQPDAELAQLRRALRPGGMLALGYQLRQSILPMAQRSFPKAGHLLYDSDDELSKLLDGAGFKEVRFLLRGPSEAPYGRLALCTA
jgi:SAM-dependent methyltransferase